MRERPESSVRAGELGGESERANGQCGAGGCQFCACEERATGDGTGLWWAVVRCGWITNPGKRNKSEGTIRFWSWACMTPAVLGPEVVVYPSNTQSPGP